MIENIGIILLKRTPIPVGVTLLDIGITILCFIGVVLIAKVIENRVWVNGEKT